jgi:hypothetical protein
MDISFEFPYYKIYKTEKFSSIKKYCKFSNWVQAEFDLFLIDDFEGLTVYFPNGWFSIKLRSQNIENVLFEIKLYCKSKERGIEIFNVIETVYEKFIHINTLKV